MGNVGFRSGKLIADRLKVSGQYVAERQFINYDDMDATRVSGTVAVATAIGGQLQAGVPTYNFSDVGVLHYIAFRYVAPLSLKSNTKCNLKLYWSSPLSGAAAGAVVWDADYWVTSVLISGIEASGRRYNISGVTAADPMVANGVTTATTEYQLTSSVVSGVIQTTDLVVPAGEIAAGDFVKILLHRDIDETADDLVSDASLIGVLIEYVEA